MIKIIIIKIKTKIKIKMTMTMRMTMTMKMRMRMGMTIIIKIFFSEQNIKISYYWFNRQEILEEAKKTYSKEKAAEYYLQNKEIIKEKAKNRYKNFSEEEKNKIKEYQKKRYQELIQYKKEALKNKLINLPVHNIIMSEKTLKFNNVKVNKKEFHKSKLANDLDSVDTNKIVVSDRFRHSEECFKYFIGYQEDEIVKPLCIILPQMNGYIKHFENGGKNMSFLIKNSDLREKYEDIWNVIKNKLNIKFHSQPIYENKYLKAKVREFDGNIKTNLLGNNLPKENTYYACIACITIDSIMKIDKKNYPQVYLEECKYKIKKINTPRFINIESESDSESDVETDSESNKTTEN